MRHEVEVGQVRDSVAWWARVRSYEASVVHSDPRGAVVIAAMRDGVDIVEVLAPGVETRAEACGYLEARRGALLAEVDRLTARDRVAWGAMPTRAEVQAHWWRGGLWAMRGTHLPAKIMVLGVRKGTVVFRYLTGKAWCAITEGGSEQWRAVSVEEVTRG